MSDSGWLTLIEEHLERYEGMTARDVYKLLYQGILGPEHSIPSTEDFTARLEEELVELQPDPGERLLEAIRPDGKLKRIHLRAWLATGQDISRLVEACLETGKQPWGTLKELSQIWYRFLDEVEEGRFPTILGSEARGLDNWLQEDHFPAAHHSTQYRSLYQPAYRLVAYSTVSGIYDDNQIVIRKGQI